MGRSRRLRVCPPVPRTHAQAPTRRASDRADGKPPKLERSDESQVERSIDTSSPDPPCRDSGPLQAGCGPRSSRTVPPVVATADSEPGPRRPAVTAGAPGSGRAGPVMAWWPGTPLARAGAARRRCVAHGGAAVVSVRRPPALQLYVTTSQSEQGLPACRSACRATRHRVPAVRSRALPSPAQHCAEARRDSASSHCRRGLSPGARSRQGCRSAQTAGVSLASRVPHLRHAAGRA